MKIEYVVSFANACKGMFDAHKTRYVTYNPALADTWEAEKLVPAIEDVSTMIGTLGLTNQKIDDTKARNVFMDNETAVLDDLEFRIKQCIVAGTITESLGSFGLAAFHRSINKYAIDRFHGCYVLTSGKVNEVDNLAALADVGFGPLQVAAMKGNHDGAWDLNDDRIAIKQEITDLSGDNQLLIMVLLGYCQLILDTVKGWGKANGDKVLVKSATVKAVLSSVTPTQPKEPKKRHFKANSVNVFRTDLGLKYLIQLTLLTKGVVVMVCRRDLKTSPCVDGLVLEYGKLWEGKLADIPGTGKYIIITVVGVKGVSVLYFVVPG
jgi:hypothetical protein